MNIELEKHIGTGYSGQDVDHGQWRVKADGQHVGYLPYAEGSWFAPIIRCVNSCDMDELVEAISAKVGWQVGGRSELPPLQDTVTEEDFEDE